jgi:hypothetical protein
MEKQNRPYPYPAEVARLEEKLAADRSAAAAQMQDLGRRMGERLDEIQQRTAELERRKLSVADFGATLATPGRRFRAESGPGPVPGGLPSSPGDDVTSRGRLTPPKGAVHIGKVRGT